MEENQASKIHFWPIMIAIFFGNFVSVLSTTTINIAVPLLMDHFNTSLNTMQWMVTGFMLATGVTAPLAGYLGGRFSYKKLYLFALMGFTMFSLLCALAWDPTSLIVFRMLQGSCSGLIMAHISSNTGRTQTFCSKPLVVIRDGRASHRTNV